MPCVSGAGKARLTTMPSTSIRRAREKGNGSRSSCSLSTQDITHEARPTEHRCILSRMWRQIGQRNSFIV